MRFLIAISLIAGLVLVPSASASSCPGASSCPWTQVDTLGDVGDGEFRAPYGVDADGSGNLYVVENDTHRVQKLDSDGNFLASWGGEGTSDGKLTYPTDIAVDAATGTVYVVDSNNQRIEKFDTGGSFVSAWGWGVSDGAKAYQVCTSACRDGAAGGGAGQMSYPTGIATDGANVYLADHSNKRIEKFDLAGAFVGQWAIPGGQQPEQLTVAAGKVYVTTRENAVWRFDQNGVPDSSWDGDGAAGSSGSGSGQFSFPSGVAVDGTGVYVADSKNNRVEKFDLNGAFASSWGSAGAGDGQFNQPSGILATGGAVWVTDAYNHRVQKFSQAGAHQLTVGKPLGIGDFYFPADVATTPSGAAYVADWSGRDIQRLDGSGKAIARWSTKGAVHSVTPTAAGIFASETINHLSLYDDTGNLLNQFGGTGSGQGQLGFPGGSVADADGNVYVAERSNDRVQKFSPAGAPLAIIGSVGSADGQLDSPYDVALDSAGNIYVTDAANHRVEKFDPSGAFLAKWGSRGSGDGEFEYPSGITVDGGGHVFVADSYNNRIQEFDAKGQFMAKWGTLGTGPGELSTPAGISIDSAGALWVADYGNHRIVRFCCFSAQGDPAPGGGQPSDTGAAPDTTAPSISLSGRSAQRSRLVRKRGVALSVSASERAAVSLRALVSRRDAHRLGLPARVVARTATDLAEPGTRALRLRLSARARRALPRLRTVKIVIRATAADPAGNRSGASRTIFVRR